MYIYIYYRLTLEEPHIYYFNYKFKSLNYATDDLFHGHHYDTVFL